MLCSVSLLLFLLLTIKSILKLSVIVFLCFFGGIPEHVIWICKHFIQAYEFASRNLLNSNDICLLGAINYLEVIPWSKVVL
jgi:hypothetical protein